MTDKALKTTRAGTDGATHLGTNRKTRKPKKGRKRTGRMKSPTGGRNQVTHQTRRAINRTRGTSQDCTRVFPVKGAANELCNPETTVRGGSGNGAAGHAGLRGNPSYDAPESLGPPLSPASLQDKQAKGGPSLSHKRSRLLEGALPGLHFVEDIGNRGKSRREVRGAKQRRNREVPGFSEAGHTPGNPDIGRAATSNRGRGRSRRGVGVEVRTTRIGGPRGEKDDGLAVSQAPAPGTRQASRCKRRCLGKEGVPKDSRNRLSLNDPRTRTSGKGSR